MKISKTVFRDKRFLQIMILMGFLILGGVGAASYQADISKAAQVMEDTVDYVGGQYIICDKFNADSVTKSLDRMVERVRQVQRYLDSGEQPVDSSLLENCAADLRLTGIILLDPEGNVQCEYRQDDAAQKELGESLQKEALLDVSRYHLKTYAARLDVADGSLIDVVKAHQQIDQCRLTAASRTDNRNTPSRLYGQIKVFDQMLLRRIGKADML